MKHIHFALAILISALFSTTHVSAQSAYAGSKEKCTSIGKLQALVGDLRADLDSPELIFVAGQVINVPAINDQIAMLPGKVPNTAFVSPDGLKGQDRWHFDTESMKKLGERYAEAVLKIGR